MQLCSWKRPGLLECGKVCLVYPGWLSGFGFVHISSEIGPESSCKLSCGRTAEPSACGFDVEETIGGTRTFRG